MTVKKDEKEWEIGETLTKTTIKIFALFLLIRIASIIFVQTFYEADEYWQSLEVAHKVVFGYGYLTWEWIEGIRSYIYPLIFAAVYQILYYIGLDTPLFLIYAPRFLEALLSAYSDLCFYRWSGELKWAAYLMACQWFWFYMGSRTLINSFETSLTIIALNLFPWRNKINESGINFLWLVAFLCAIRPTAAILWLPLCIYHLHLIKNDKMKAIFITYIPIGLTVLFITTLIDSLMYRKLTITSLNFLNFNLLKGGASFYGEQPWYWYLSFGIPAVLGMQLIPFLLGSFKVLRNPHVYETELMLLGAASFTILVLSCLPHKEFRFLTPILPLFLFVAARYLSEWSRKASSLIVWIVSIVLLITQLTPAYHLGISHQRGTLSLMTPLREIIDSNPNNTSFLFLMPCHSTPLYSHLHKNITTRFLTCNPNLTDSPTYVDESSRFYQNPSAWLRKNIPPNGTLPSHIISYDVLVPQITDILSRYKPIHRIFHTNFPLSKKIGNYVIVHELVV